MAQIRNLKDNGGNVFYPLTHERAVKDSNGVTLETKLAELNSRPYDPQNPNGMGYLVLEKDKSFASQVTAANTIYEIRYEFDLNNATVTIPAGCVLKFNGGSITNGTITFDKTKVCFIGGGFSSCRFSGNLSPNQQVFVSGFGVVADGVTDDSIVINDIYKIVENCGCEIVFDCDGDYGIKTQDVTITSNTTTTFTGKGFLKSIGYGGVGTLIYILNKTNIVINNIRIDNNFMHAGGSGKNGISIMSSQNVKIYGGIIKNCARGDYVLSGTTLLGGDGGKGIQTENSGNSDFIVDNVAFYDCFIAISARTSKTSDTIKQALKFTNIYANNCPIFGFAALVNAIDLDESSVLVSFDNFTAENCGWYFYGDTSKTIPQQNNTDYTGEDPGNANHGLYIDEGGVFVFDRGTNVHITNGQIIGDKAAKYIFAGTLRSSYIKDVTIDQECIGIFSSDSNFYGRAQNAPGRIVTDIVIRSSFSYFLSSTINSPRKSFNNSLFRTVFYNYPATNAFRGDVLTNLTSMAEFFVFNKDSVDTTAANTWKFYNGPLVNLTFAPLNGALGNIDKINLSTSISDRPSYFPTGRQWLYAPSNGSRVYQGFFLSNPNKYVEWDGAQLGIARYGTTAERPASTWTKPIGFTYFDTELGKMIVWNGSDWVNMDGTALS